MTIKGAIHAALRRLGYDLVIFNNADSERRYIDIFERVRPFTISSYERIYALVDSTRYVLQNNISGAFVECGVYKGGGMMAIALALMAEGVIDRDLYLFDTFEGMPAPEARDVDFWGTPASKTFSRTKISDVSSTWYNCSSEDVARAMASTGYPRERIHLVKGLAEQTIPDRAPESIAFVRLDTDWHQSTMHELVHLFPRVSPKGVIIIDDYGHFSGAREAVHEFFGSRKMSPFLHRLDYTARLIIKND